MNCKEIEALLLTDYLDSQLPDRQKKDMDQHLAHCPRCREFLAEVRKTVVEPFVKAEDLCPPEIVWSRIKESILTEQQRENLIVRVWKRLRSYVFVPNPVWAMATVMMLMVLVGLGTRLKMNHDRTMNARTQEQMDYLASLVDDPADLSVSDERGFGTLIEKYFL